MVFISNGSKMDSCPDNIQNSMIPLRGDYGIFNVQNFQIPNKLFLFFFQHSFSCDTSQVTLNCLEGSVYIMSYLWPFRPTNWDIILMGYVYILYTTYQLVMCTL